jgi:uncharacterized protein YndB with AHSA1/START domain
LPDLLQTITIAAPITTVWAEITKLGGKQRAMLDTVLRTTLEGGNDRTTLVVGAPLYYTSEDGKRVFIVGRVVEVDPPHRLVHTQRLTMRDDPPTLVTWELAEIEGGTRVTLRHTGFPEGTKKLESVDKTWIGILRELKRLLEAGDIGLGARARYAVFRRFMWALPSGTKAENVTVPD